MANASNVTPLRAMRHASGLSIRRLEILCGINRGRLSMLERGIPPTEAEMAAILKALGKAA